jgi:hypothetical protein
MLVNTKSFGAPYGKENAINIYRNFTEVNNLAKYAITKKIYVRVLNSDGSVSKDAKVEFQLYNYAEFYPLATIKVNDQGISSFETGLGDLMIWAYNNKAFAFRKIKVSNIDTLTLTLGNSVPEKIDLDLSVPPVLTPFKGPSPELIAKNNERNKNGDQVRKNYIDTWMSRSESIKFAAGKQIDTARFARIITRSMGNYAEIIKLFSNIPDSLVQRAVSLMEILPDKDLRDTKHNVLLDHLLNTYRPERKGGISDSIFLYYVLNPRISNEILVSWRTFLLKDVPVQFRTSAMADPEEIVKYINESIRIAEDENYSRTPITPRGTGELRVSDTQSRSIYFVAICRTLGIPARMEPARQVPQYLANNTWKDVRFADQEPSVASRAYLSFTSTEKNPEPQYYVNFTIARFENGKYHTLEYDYNKKVSDFNEVEVLPGNYMLVTGNRQSDGSILSSVGFFTVAENEHRRISIELRRESNEKKILGFIDAPKIAAMFPGRDDIVAGCSNKGVIVAWVEAGKEPTNHIFNDLPAFRGDLDKWGGHIIFLNAVPSKDSWTRNLHDLSSGALFGDDANLQLFRKTVKMDTVPDMKLPVIIVADPHGNILFYSSGYRIGIGEQLVKYLYISLWVELLTTVHICLAFIYPDPDFHCIFVLLLVLQKRSSAMKRECGLNPQQYPLL